MGFALRLPRWSEMTALLALLCFVYIGHKFWTLPGNSPKKFVHPGRLAFDSLRVSVNGLSRSCLVGPHERDWGSLAQMIKEGKPFAFVRFGDGERMLALGEPVGKQAQAYVVD